MTNEEWLVQSDDPHKLLRSVIGDGWVDWIMPTINNKPTHRQLRLFGFALWELYNKNSKLKYIDNYDDLEWIDQLHTNIPDGRWNLYIQPPVKFATEAINYYTNAGIKSVGYATPAIISDKRNRLDEEITCSVIRDIFSNHIHKFEITNIGPTGSYRCPKCRNSLENTKTPEFIRCANCKYTWVDFPWADRQIIDMAIATYGTGNTCILDQSNIMVLADALDDNGCSDIVLNHLRLNNQHYRGCWVIDTVLNKGQR